MTLYLQIFRHGLENQLFYLMIYFYPLVFSFRVTLWGDPDDGIWNAMSGPGRYFGMDKCPSCPSIRAITSAAEVISGRGSSELE